VRTVAPYIQKGGILTVPPVLFESQSPDELRLALVHGPLALSQFRVLTSRTLSGGLRADCHIIGTSHAILFSCDDQPLWEVFACQEVNEEPPLFKLADAVPVTTTLSSAVHKFNLWTVTTGKLEDSLNRLRLCPFYLKFVFPPSPDGSGSALTAISGTTDAMGITIHTLHSYPNHGQVVLTCSRFERS